jgi:glycosidase
MDELSSRWKKQKKDFWLMGEMVAGEYCRLTGGGSSGVAPGKRLDSVTNYELYKSLWSSFNDKNFFELSWTLNRQSGPNGLYRDIPLYTFADNHDVNRIASIIKNKAHLFPLYGLLFTLPGIPSIYYGSEYGITGEHAANSDDALRPAWDSQAMQKAREAGGLAADLERAIAGFIALRKSSAALREGSFRELFKDHEQYAFMREAGDERVLVGVNAGAETKTIRIPREALGCGSLSWRDLLSGEEFGVRDGRLEIPVHPSWMTLSICS